jgi:hypothetical protein
MRERERERERERFVLGEECKDLEGVDGVTFYYRY